MTSILYTYNIQIHNMLHKSYDKYSLYILLVITFMEHVMNLYIICIKNICHNFYGACYEFVYYMYKENNWELQIESRPTSLK
jgi:hypothetical protein